MPPERAGRLLRSLAAGGWLTRARRGLYIPVPLEAARSGDWHEDPWLIAAGLLSRDLGSSEAPGPDRQASYRGWARTMGSKPR